MSLLTRVLPPEILLIAFAVALVAGFVKGAVGFALPLILVSGLSTIMDPRLAIAALVVPTVAANLVQAMQSGVVEAGAAFRDFWKFIIAASVMVFVVTQSLPSIPPRLMYLLIGAPVLVLSLVQLAGVRFRVAVSARPVMDVVVGLVAGSIGGIAGTWGPPTVLYLLALNVERARQMTTQGVVYALGSVALLAGHAQSGLLNRETLPFSIALLLPTSIGMAVGIGVGRRLDATLFRRLTLAILAIAGANLIRRSLVA